MSNGFDTLTVERGEAQGGQCRFVLRGVIDAHAAQPLKALEAVPDGTEVVLDFREIQRVNSMGLALLAEEIRKLEARHCRVQVENPNRMVSLLFKVSGFGRWIGLAESAQAQRAAPSLSRPIAPASKGTAPVARKWRLVAEVGVSHRLNGWFLFNTYLQRQLQVQMGFQPLEGEVAGDLVFVNPCLAASLILARQFEPLAKPSRETDEVIIATRHGQACRPASWKRIAVTSRQSFTYLLGRFMLDEAGVDSGEIAFEESRTEIKAVQMVVRGQVDAIFLSKRTYSGLSSFSKKQLEVCDESRVELAAHLLCAGPTVPQEARERLKAILFRMGGDPKGSQILKELEIVGWEPVAQEELDLLLNVFRRYCPGDLSPQG